MEYVRGSTCVVTAWIAAVVACGTSPDVAFSVNDAGPPDATRGVDAPAPADATGLLGDGNGNTVDGAQPGDPQTCLAAQDWHSYIGCDYWPTVTANSVWSIFDYAVVVANAGANKANVTVTGPGNTYQMATVDAGQLTVLYLPWVPALKGPDFDTCGNPTPLASSVLARGAAYHLVSSVPVTVYQFNALEFQSIPGVGAPGKDWNACPGFADQSSCSENSPAGAQCSNGCCSWSNDASLLLPTTAMTGNYRVTGHGGWGAANMGAYMALTATRDGTTVSIHVSSGGQIIAGSGIAATSAGGTLTLSMNAGDVAELFGAPTDGSDLSGSLVTANRPIQVITGMQCLDVPSNAAYCDHVEESNYPVETHGKDYVVAQPLAPRGTSPVGQDVRIYGDVDGTKLTYDPPVSGCPTAIDAGQSVDCGIVHEDFEVKGDHPFSVAVFTQSATVVDPNAPIPPFNYWGDPDQSLPTAVEQYRSQYVFLTPPDYFANYVVVTAPQGASIVVDGTPLTGTASASVGDFAIWRAQLGLQPQGQGGAHVLTASKPVGIQVMGYGLFTSYQYPGGLDLAQIAPTQ
jgi:hypothetical protein